MHATRDDLRGQGCLSIRHGKGPISRLEFGCIRDGGNAFDKGASALFQPGLRADSRQRANPHDAREESDVPHRNRSRGGRIVQQDARRGRTCHAGRGSGARLDSASRVDRRPASLPVGKACMILDRRVGRWRSRRPCLAEMGSRCWISSTASICLAVSVAPRPRAIRRSLQNKLLPYPTAAPNIKAPKSNGAAARIETADCCRPLVPYFDATMPGTGGTWGEGAPSSIFSAAERRKGSRLRLSCGSQVRVSSTQAVSIGSSNSKPMLSQDRRTTLPYTS